jgi:xanthine dehydrogenase YagS FAD-binding subunit
MKEFAYRRAANVQEAVAMLDADPEARFLAGGTNMVDLMKAGVEKPTQLIDVQELPLDRVEVTSDGGLHIGAMVTNSDVAAHPEVRRRYPALAQAVLAGASGQLRNMATVGGNLLQRTRCAYFADTAKPCNKREPGSGPSDMAVAMAAFDAIVSVETVRGPSTIPLPEFYLPVGETPQRETSMPPGALITGVTLPPAPVAARSRYRKVRERASYAFATGSIAAALDVRGGLVRDVRLAFGAVASQPWRAWTAERALVGGPATAAAFAAAAEAELSAAVPLPDNEYKVLLMRNLVVAVLTELAGEITR